MQGHAAVTDVTRAERRLARAALANLCVCQHALDRHTLPSQLATDTSCHGACRDCRRKPWPCSHFVSVAAARAADRTVGPAWTKGDGTA